MDGSAEKAAAWRRAPFRCPRFRAREVEVSEGAGGSVVLRNPVRPETDFRIMTDPLRHWARLAPERVWLAERDAGAWRTLNYGDAWQALRALAGGLADADLIGAAPMLILARNGVDHALMAYAAMGQGMPVAPVSPQYGLPGANPGRLAHAVATLRPALVFTEDAELFSDALDAEFLRDLPVVALRNARRRDIRFQDLLAAAPRDPVARPEDHAKYLLTSGSTGLPKAVICEHRNIVINAAQQAAVSADGDPPTTVNSAPWSHSLGANTILHGVAHRGGSLYIDAGQPVAGRFAETLRNLREVAPTFHHMVPAGWMLLAGELEADAELARIFFARVRLLQYGGANLSQEVCDRIQAVAVRTVGERISFASGYGATETGPTVTNVHWSNDRMGLLGLPLPGTEIKLTPQDGKLEARVRGPQVTRGYLGRETESAAAFDEEGFYRLGDAARFVDPCDPQAGLVFDGRLSENFKLTTGAFVSTGDLRIAVLGAIGDLVTDAVVCGEGRDRIGLMFYPRPGADRRDVLAAIREGVAQFNARASGAGSRVGRALLLAGPPDPHAGEVTDKGYLAQALARRLRSADVGRLYAEPPPADVLEF